MQKRFSANVLLWTAQGLLALFFAAGSGAPKLLVPPEMLPMPIPLPEPFIKFVGVCEVLGALGLILPGITRIQPRLTVVAAACLTLLTVCAATYQLIGQQPANAIFALVIGVIAASIAYGRRRTIAASADEKLLVHHGAVVV